MKYLALAVWLVAGCLALFLWGADRIAHEQDASEVTLVELQRLRQEFRDYVMAEERRRDRPRLCVGRDFVQANAWGDDCVVVRDAKGEDWVACGSMDAALKRHDREQAAGEP